jgi:hypothetical protein
MVILAKQDFTGNEMIESDDPHRARHPESLARQSSSREFQIDDEPSDSPLSLAPVISKKMSHPHHYSPLTGGRVILCLVVSRDPSR